MAARYEIGDPDRPRGHALLYFRVSGGDEVLATYLIVLPIAINPARYIPPAFAARMPTPAQEVDATALPPIPETAEDVAITAPAGRAPGDDLLDGGIVEGDPERLMMVTAEVSREYSERYQAAVPGPARRGPRGRGGRRIGDGRDGPALDVPGREGAHRGAGQADRAAALRRGRGRRAPHPGHGGGDAAPAALPPGEVPPGRVRRRRLSSGGHSGGAWQSCTSTAATS